MNTYNEKTRRFWRLNLLYVLGWPICLAAIELWWTIGDVAVPMVSRLIPLVLMFIGLTDVLVAAFIFPDSPFRWQGTCILFLFGNDSPANRSSRCSYEIGHLFVFVKNREGAKAGAKGDRRAYGRGAGVLAAVLGRCGGRSVDCKPSCSAVRWVHAWPP